VTDTHIRYPITQRLLEVLGQALERLLLLLLGLTLGLILDLLEVELALSDGLERVLVILAEVRDQPFVDGFAKQQHLNALLTEQLQMGAVLRRLERIAGDVIDALLTFTHAADVVVQRHDGAAVRIVGRMETQQACDALLIGRILDRPLLEDATELIPELGVVLGAILGELVQRIQHALDVSAANTIDELIMLEQLARDIQGQVIGIHEAAYETQPARQQALRVIHDEHAPNIELHAVRLLAVEEVKRPTLGNEQQRGVGLIALDLVVDPGQRLIEVVRDVLVERLVLVVADLVLGTQPQR